MPTSVNAFEVNIVKIQLPGSQSDITDLTNLTDLTDLTNLPLPSGRYDQTLLAGCPVRCNLTDLTDQRVA